MSNPFSSAANKTQYSVSVTHRPEVPYMITEGRLEHLDAIAIQIEKYEKWEPKWDIVKIFMSAFASLALFSAGLLIANSATETPSIATSILFWVKAICMGATFAALLAFIINCVHSKERKEQYKDEANKIRDIIKKVKESVI